VERAVTPSTIAEVSRRSMTTASGEIWVNRFFARPAPTCTDTIPSRIRADGGTEPSESRTPRGRERNQAARP